jgi:photosystem II stability/assembly factor-like uncharacterized protein
MKRALFVFIVLLLAVGTTGCIKIKKDTGTTGNLGGVFVSSDRMETWKHRSLLMTPGETPGSIGGVNVYFLKFDPSDKRAAYLGTYENGLYYTYNGGAGWNHVDGLGSTFIRDIAIDTKNKCRLYAAIGTKIFRSEDCSRTWKEIMYTDSGAKAVTALAVDWFNPQIVYAGLSDGTFMRSEDYGNSWHRMAKFPTRVRKVEIDPFDSRHIFVGLINHAIYKTEDKGKSWKDLSLGMKDFKGSDGYADFMVSSKSRGLVVYASNYGLLRSLDGGITWKPIHILSSPGEEPMYAVAIDQNNSNNLYYATDKALYKSIDAGDNWVVKRMPTTRIVRDLLVHPTDSNLIYMGVFTPSE